MRRYGEHMTSPLAPDLTPFWIIGVTGGLLSLIIGLLLTYMVIRLAITHGMLSYSRQLAESRGQTVHRD